MEQKARAKPAKVLRAADVIPPFNQDLGWAGCAEIEPPPGKAALKQGGNGDRRPGGAAEEVNSAGGDVHPTPETSALFLDVPVFDLAENILAEQRRTATRRRRAPRQGSQEPAAMPEQTRPRPAYPEPSDRDLLELQQIVAEIVARDIARLCRRPDGPLPA